MDGLCAAAVAKKWARLVKGALPSEVETRQCDYGAPIDVEDARGKTVLVTDFAFPPETMKALADAAFEFIWIDHHESNKALTDEVPTWPWRGMPSQKPPQVFFDLVRSGAGIAHDVLFPHEQRPWIVNYVEDRDLWRFALPQSREINCWVQALPKAVEAYAVHLDKILVPMAVLSEGESMIRYLDAWTETVADTARLVDFLEWKDVLITTCTYSGIADVLERMLAKGTAPVALAWLQRKDGIFQYSVRTNESVDASEIARRFGGGGHKRAAGFQSRVLFPWEQRTP